MAFQQSTAEHFCQLMVCNSEGAVTPLRAYIRQQGGDAGDSLTVEQLFTSYVFDYHGWQTLKIFPYRSAQGTVVWLAAADPLPDDMDAEHQKYIQEVFPRLQEELEHEHWTTADAYIDRMLQYQSTFGAPLGNRGGTPLSSSVFLPLMISLLVAFFSIPFISKTTFSPSKDRRRPQ